MEFEKSIDDLALFGGKPLFSTIRSISNLVAPDFDVFLSYLKKSYDARCLTNNGPMVKEMERRLAEIHGTEDCVVFCNGLWGIVLCIYCLAPEGKTEVVMPSLTYRRLGDIASWLGLTPHYCDVDCGTLAPTAKTIETCINGNTSMILVTQPMVNILDYDELTALAEKYNLPLLIDSVEAGYATCKGRKVGSFGNAECFSMHASKLLNGFEAGYATTSDLELAERLREIRTFGFSGQDNVEELGLNAVLNEMHAAMAVASIDDLEDQVERNRERYRAYQKVICNIPGLELVEYDETEVRGFKNILVRIDGGWPISRNDMISLLHAENMLVRPYYNPPLHVKETEYRTISGELPVTDKLTENHLLLPSGAFLSLQEIEEIGVLLCFLQKSGKQIQKIIEENKYDENKC